MTNAEFEQLVKQAILKLKPKARELLKECYLSIKKCPPKDLEAQLLTLGCFRGKPKGTVQGGLTHASIELFKDDILFCNRFKRKVDLINHITDILAHEIAHYLGCPEGEANLNLDLFKHNIKKEGFKKERKPNEKSLNHGRKWFWRKWFNKKTS